MHLPAQTYRTSRLFLPATVLSLAVVMASADRAPAADVQPLRAQVKRVTQVLEFLGAPLPSDRQAALDDAVAGGGDDYAKAAAAVQRVLDPMCLAHVNINPESRVKVGRGAAPAELAQHG